MKEEYKNFLISTAPNKGSMKEIKVIGKGSVVMALRGLYTSVREAKIAIDKYEIANEGKRNGKTKSAS